MKRYLFFAGAALIILFFSVLSIYLNSGSLPDNGNFSVRTNNNQGLVAPNEAAEFFYIFKNDSNSGKVKIELPLPEGFELDKESINYITEHLGTILEDGSIEVEINPGEIEVISYDAINTTEIEKDLSELQDKPKEEIENEEINLDEIEIDSFGPLSVYTNLDNYLSIKGDNLSGINELILKSENEEKVLSSALALQNELGFNLPNNYLQTGNYEILLKAGGEKIQTNFNLTVKAKNGPIISNITPDIGIFGEQNMIVLQGEGFNDLIGMQLSNGTIITRTSFEIISDRVLAVRISEDVLPGKYYFRLVTEKGFFEDRDISYTVISN